MIQKRIVIVTSFQPSNSKWCCSGAILNSRLPPEILNQPTWSTTDAVMTTNSPAITAINSSVRVRIERLARAPPIASEPVSPMKIFAGDAFHQRNPKQAPAMAIETTARS